ncbi:putative K(+) antiporter 1 [Zalerion maritima]|uniref:K(+) antiporter 1 n=1 Tax=Zalerion maritima TaxID=339359 RepID=A0AAD5WQN5_9PEZI|nr:putative K(+) antiporter 1 [Zalerion maritima]
MSSASNETRHLSQGVVGGENPISYNASEPIALFMIQVIIITLFCRLLQYPLGKLRQPRVIAEVIGGILLGPSVMMRIPGFQASIFPVDSMPILNNAANLGLILFLFLVGLEVDFRTFASNWRVAGSVGLAGMLLPFALGCGISRGLYDSFRDEDGQVARISFGVYALFIGTALSITAFPVLCRILSELNLFSTTVGMTVLAAGVGNDVTGWILLALIIGLVNSGSGLTALWVLLCCVGWILLLVFAVKPALLLALRRTDTFRTGPGQGVVWLTLLLVLVSSWFTAIIGVHAIFGAFLVGLICPHEGGFGIKMTEKIEDLVTVLLLPLYFTLSGLKTDIGLLSDKLAWAYVVGVIAVAFVGKVVGGAIAAKACKLSWRESLAIGVLMSCKGLVELIVLNIGLQAGILSQKTFTIFVLMALVTTVTTTPLTRWIYPPNHQSHHQHSDSKQPGDSEAGKKPAGSPGSGHTFQNITLQLSLDSILPLLSLALHLGTANKRAERIEHGTENSLVTVHGIHMLPLTERTSSVMHLTEKDGLGPTDSVATIFEALASAKQLSVTARAIIAPIAAYTETLISRAIDANSDLLIIPWTNQHSASSPESLSQQAFSSGQIVSGDARVVSTMFNNAASRVTSAVLVPSTNATLPGRHWLGTLSPTPQAINILVPFIGSRDDVAALAVAAQIITASEGHAFLTLLRLCVEDDSPAASARRSPHQAEGAASGDEWWSSMGVPLVDALAPGQIRVLTLDLPGEAKIVSTCLAHMYEAAGEKGHEMVIVGRNQNMTVRVDSGASAAAAGGEFGLAVGPLAAAISTAEVDVLVVQGGDKRSVIRATDSLKMNSHGQQ